MPRITGSRTAKIGHFIICYITVNLCDWLVFGFCVILYTMIFKIQLANKCKYAKIDEEATYADVVELGKLFIVFIYFKTITS